MYTMRWTEREATLAVIDADAYAIGVYNTAWADMSVYHRAVAFLNVGDMAQGSTVDLLLQEATDAAGAGAQAIAGKAITQLTQAGGDGDDICIIELRSEELDENNAFRFVRAVLTVAGGASDAFVLVLGTVPRYLPVPVANVTEIID